MKTTQIGVDLAKSVFEVAVSQAPGRVHERQRLSRTGFRRFFACRAPSEGLMEACGSAHHWGRELQALGHRVTLLPAGDVARYRDGNKTDRADAKAVLAGGLRKLRWRPPGRGKRGGTRVIYYWSVQVARLYLLFLCPKNARSELTKAQLRTLRGVVS